MFDLNNLYLYLWRVLGLDLMHLCKASTIPTVMTANNLVLSRKWLSMIPEANHKVLHYI